LKGKRSETATTGLVAPVTQKQLQARLKVIAKVLEAGLLAPPLLDALSAEKARLEKVLLAGAGGSTARLASPELFARLNARLKEIDKALLAGTVTAALERQLKSERAQIQKLLRSA
jgi:hypothetical protein